jgi:hypothetical protein
MPKHRGPECRHHVLGHVMGEHGISERRVLRVSTRFADFIERGLQPTKRFLELSRNLGDDGVR